MMKEREGYGIIVRYKKAVEFQLRHSTMKQKE